MATQNNNYFDFTADAVGYIDEVKVVKPRGNSFIALKATLLEGKDGQEKIPMDLI